MQKVIVTLAALVGLFCFMLNDAGALHSAESMTGIDAATAATPGVCSFAYLAGTGNHDIATLRRFRDEVLAQNRIGRIIIEQYYTHDNQLLELLQVHPVFREAAKRMLQCVVPACELILEEKP